MKVDLTQLNFTVDTIQRFSAKIRYNVEMYLDMYSYFIQNNQSNITDYFTKKNSIPDPDSFTFLAQLISEAVKISSFVSIHKDSFTLIDEWEMLDFLEDIKISLQTVDNTYKYTRSAKSKNSWRTTGITSNHTLGQNETLEDVVVNEFQSDEWDDDWVDIALKNNLGELDYTPQGGNVLQIEKGINFLGNVFLNSVVDTLAGERLYGADLAKKLTWSNDDLLILGYRETFLQSVDILITLKKGDVPEFKNMGIDYVIGSNMGVFQYGKVKRQLESNMSSDDTIRNFSVITFKYTNGDLFLDYQVDSFYNLNFKNSTKV